MLGSREGGKRSRTSAILFAILVTSGFVGTAWYYGRSDHLSGIVPPGSEKARVAPKESHASDSAEPAQIVGIQTCARCHPSQAEAFATSGHSRTFAHTRQSEIARSLHGQTFVDPERKYSYLYQFDPQNGLSVSIPGKIDRQFPLQYALGSGTHAVTFIGLVPNRKPEGGLQTIGIEHRVSVFPNARQQRLNLTFGHAGRQAEHEVTEFGKVEEAASLDKCVECHTTSGTIEKLAVINLRENVTCENCHGPGSKHVAAADRGLAAPGHLDLIPGSYSTIDQMQKCGSCHRLPDMVDVHHQRRDNAKITRFQPVGMQKSRCFKESSGRLSCTTCHNPHRGVRHDNPRDAAHCLKCHQRDRAGQTACPVSPAADCVRCHMPAVPSLHEVSFTDHWIRVRDKRDPEATESIPLPHKKRE